MHKAKSKFSQLVYSAPEGEEVAIAKSGKPEGNIIPCKPTTKRQRGLFKGQIKISDDFDSPKIQQEIADEFGML